MKYLRLWYFSNKRKYVTFFDEFRPGEKIDFAQPSFCKFSKFEQATERNIERDAENWFKFFKAYVPSEVLRSLYRKLEKYYGV